MIKIGILGDIGSGKSFIAKCFGYPVFNADEEVPHTHYISFKVIYNYIFRIRKFFRLYKLFS